MKKLIVSAFIFLVANNGYCARLAPDVQTESFDDFSGGLYTTLPAHKIPKTFSPGMQNVYIDQGKIESSGGTSVIGSTPTLVNTRSIAVLNKSDGTRIFFVSDSSIVLATQDFLSYTFIRGGLNISLDIAFKQIGDLMWCSNGFDSVFVTSGTSASVLDGTNGTPNVPKAKYIEYYQNRVWIANINSADSDVYFSAIIDTNGVIIAPTNYLAWPSANSLHINQGDGKQITFMRVYNGILRVGKELGVFTIFGNLPYTPQKTVADTGFISNIGISELDGLLYGQGKPDGFYTFDGSTMRRISDYITPNVQAAFSDTRRVVSNFFDTKTQFDAGAIVAGATTTVNGLVTILSTQTSQVDPRGIADSDLFIYEDGGGDPVKNATFSAILTPSPVDLGGFKSGFIDRVRLFYSDNGRNDSNQLMRLDVYNLTNSEHGWGFLDASKVIGQGKIGYCGACTMTDIKISPQIDFSSGDFYNGNIKYKWEVQVNSPPFNSAPGYSVKLSNIQFSTHSAAIYYGLSGNYQSGVTTVSSNITFWDVTNIVDNKNTGSITYGIRGATSAVNISTEIYTPLVSGAIVTLPLAKRFVQFTSTFVAIDTTNVPNLDSVDIRHIEGSAAGTRSFSAVWKNRLWLFISTEATGNFPIAYVKAKSSNQNPNAWMPFWGTGYNLRSLFVIDDNFYGGGASSATISLLDYGTSFNGQSIQSYYETPIMTNGSNFVDKNLMEYWIDTEGESAATMDMGTAVNGGNYSSTTLDISGTGRMTKNIYNVDKFAKSYKFRFLNSTLDKSLTLYSFTYLYNRIPLQ